MKIEFDRKKLIDAIAIAFLFAFFVILNILSHYVAGIVTYDVRHPIGLLTSIAAALSVAGIFFIGYCMGYFVKKEEGCCKK